MKHKHADMIKAKADNMELVVFCKFEDKDWIESRVDFADSFNFLCEYQYFLCLPQHKEACLHWLNGGEVQDFCEEEWMDCGSQSEWYSDHMFMDCEANYRIKTKKEKRWIATFPWCGKAFYVTPESFPSKDLLNDYVDIHYGKRELMLAHEIEVEV